jgi:lysozyme family protein
MNSNFDEALRLVLAHEGGYVNDPHDSVDFLKFKRRKL